MDESRLIGVNILTETCNLFLSPEIRATDGIVNVRSIPGATSHAGDETNINYSHLRALRKCVYVCVTCERTPNQKYFDKRKENFKFIIMIYLNLYWKTCNSK